MIKPILGLMYLESWHQRIDCKLLCNYVILYMATFCQESCADTSQREQRLSLSKPDLRAGISKQGFTEALM